MGALAIDKAGNLYGTTLEGGIVCSPSDYMGCGTIFALSPPAAGESAWTERVIHSFAGPLTDGAGPYSGIILRGNKLYGTTESGGDIGYGTVFEVSPPASPGENWTEMPIYSFNASDGSGDGPEAGVTFDPKGNLYSDTWLQPVAFELSPPIIQGNPWTYIDLYDFYDGIGEPVRGLVFEHGKLFGTAQGSGSPPNLGEVFAIIP
jgi:uncharacterized repeat protein (TIGR03803 family)